MHQHNQGVRLIGDGIDGLHSIDYGIFCGNRWHYLYILYVGVPQRICLHIHQSLSQRPNFDAQRNEYFDKIGTLLSRVDSYCFGELIHPVQLEFSQFLSSQIIRLSGHLFFRHKVKLPNIDMDHLHQWLHIGEFEIFWIKFIVYVSIVFHLLSHMILWLPKEYTELFICVRQLFMIVYIKTIMFFATWSTLYLLMITINDT